MSKTLRSNSKLVLSSVALATLGGLFSGVGCAVDSSSESLAVNSSALVDQKFQIATAYAPVVYLHSNEQYLPDSVDNFLPNVKVECDEGTIPQPATLTPSTVPNTAGYHGCRFTSKTPLTDPYMMLPFFYGRKPTASSTVPVYVQVYDVPEAGEGVFDAQYNFFYPYNWGKNACTTAAPDQNCLASRVVLGNHVGDWEHVTIRFDRSGQPVSFYVSAHGEDESDGVQFPYQIEKEATSGGAYHPVFYVAQGSHGLRVKVGDTVYKELASGDKLRDVTDRGTRWASWDNLVQITGEESWSTRRYTGVWGNRAQGSSACDLSPVELTCPYVIFKKSYPWYCYLGGAASLTACCVADREGACDAMGIPRDEFQLNSGSGGAVLERDRNRLPAVVVASGFLVNRVSGRCADVAGVPGTEGGSAIQLADCERSGGPNGTPTDQIWELLGNGFIRNKLSGLCYDVAGAPGGAGAKTALANCEFAGGPNGTPTDQRWELTADGILKNKQSGLCVDVTGTPGTAPGLQFQLWGCESASDANTDQVWRFEPAGSASCAELKRSNPASGNGDYLLSIGNHNVHVYCAGMGAGESPVEYLNLPTADANNNVSVYGAGPNSSGLITQYTKVRFYPNDLTVEVADTRFSSSSGAKTFGTTRLTTNNYAEAADCRGDRSSTGRANINLTGTGLAVSLNQFSAQGWNPAGTATYSQSNQVVNLTGGGYCGAMTLSSGLRLQLAWK